MNKDDLSIDSQSPLPGTVKYYRRHIILCTPHSDWPATIEKAGEFSGILSDGIMAAAGLKFTKITACQAPSSGVGQDLMLFPQRLRLKGLSEADIPALTRYLLGEAPPPVAAEPITNHLFLVCGHANRDPRCGRCGPDLLAALKGYLPATGLSPRMEVRLSSHLGGHRFAGIVVCYPSGNWYGRVTAEDIPKLVSAEVEGRTCPDLWRGRMGLAPEEQIATATLL